MGFPKGHIRQWLASYRTRKDRTRLLKSEAHEYATAGSYRIVVKVIDIFRNDTSQMIEVEVA